jgi:hypothetical protein
LEEEEDTFTVDEHYFMDYHSKKETIRLAVSSCFQPWCVEPLQVDSSTLPRLLPPDPMRSAIEIIAEV